MAINLIQEHGKETVMNQIYEEIQKVYLSDTRPWVIGYSGGKDSTLTAMVVFEAISQLPEEQRKKEIGIRKVIGASIMKIINLFSVEFLVLVIISILISWPVAWIIMKLWLQQFAYRIDIQIQYFITAGAAALLIAMIAVSSQLFKAALANPVSSLRND